LNKPSLDDLLQVADSRYSLVIAAAKRARQLLERCHPKVDTGSNKHVTIALHEISEGKISYQSTKTGIK